MQYDKMTVLIIGGEIMSIPSEEELKQILKTDTPYKKLLDNLDTLSDFVLTYNDYIQTSRDYGTGDFLSMMEAHVLSDVVNNPGTTTSELAKKWDRTTSAISQTVRKLSQKDYVYREIHKDNAKIFLLYPTESAINFAKAHAEYDRKGTINNRMKLLNYFSEDEIESFYDIMKVYSQIIKKQNKIENIT